MRRRLLQAATAVVLIASTLGTKLPAAHPEQTAPLLDGSAPDRAITRVDQPLLDGPAPQNAPTPPPALTAEPPRPEPADAPSAPLDPPTALWPDDAALYRLRMCESTDQYGINTENGFHGAYQYLQSTWNAIAAHAGYPDLVGVPVETVAPAGQDAVTRWWWNHSDPHQQWPVCGWRV